MTNELTYEQASVLCRVEGLPFQRRLYAGHPQEWQSNFAGTAKYDPDVWSHRLIPLAPLTANQAAICLSMGVAVEVHYGNGGNWLPCRIGDCCPSVHGYSTTSLRVPPESEETR